MAKIVIFIQRVFHVKRPYEEVRVMIIENQVAEILDNWKALHR